MTTPTDEARAGEPRAPISGMWVVSSEQELTSAIMQLAEEVLERAAVDGKQVVVTEGITFRWRPVELDGGLDVERLADALHAVQGGAFLANRADAEKVVWYYEQMSKAHDESVRRLSEKAP